MQSARLGFAIWSADDLPLALGLWGNPDVTKLTGGPFTRDQVEGRLALELAHHEQHGIQYWPLFLLATGEHVGCCGLRPRAGEADARELGYHLRTAFWGQGYAREAGNATIAHAFRDLGLSCLSAGHHPENHRSRRIVGDIVYSKRMQPLLTIVADTCGVHDWIGGSVRAAAGISPATRPQ